jgi:lipopolysaccharide transport system ATP-binding protein
LFIEARDLQKRYVLAHGGEKLAVQGATFRIEEGERVGLIGRNGAGKTTLLQILAGIAEPTGGAIEIRGRVTAIFTLGMGLREDLTGRENIFVEGELMGRSREETRALVGEIVEFAELGDFIDNPVRTYSTGMKARLAFSTIVHVEPEILIVDETLSVGDTKFSAKAGRKMRELTQKGRILILVSHSMAAVQDMCTRCIWLDAGSIREDGAPMEVTAKYLQEVRQSEDAAFLKRFQRAVADESLLPGWRVAELGMRTSEGVAASTLITGEPAQLLARMAGTPGEPVDACLRVERMDGLLVLENRASAAGIRPRMPERGELELMVDFGPLRLNYGVYRAEWTVHVAGREAARRSILFEVVNPRPPLGGRPVLIYPSTLRARPQR